MPDATTTPSSYFRTHPEFLEQEIGKQGMKWLNRLAGLYGGDIRYGRPAPSVICRSEAELLGISSPRFAIRVYFGEPGDSKKRSFVNVRRLVHLADITSRTHGRGQKHLQIGNNWPRSLSRHELREKIVRPGICIADSLLELPAHLTYEGFSAITVDLGQAYGESGQITGTPFLQHMNLGGGMCAQAACFMVLVLYERIVKGIHGIAEITAISHGVDTGSDENVPDVELGGMTLKAMERFFCNEQSVALRGMIQGVPSVANGGPGRAMIDVAMQSYLRSSCPLLHPVDLGRMSGKLPEGSGPSVLERNKLPGTRDSKGEWKTQPHVVVAVGVHQQDTHRYLFNDPATLPFIQMDVDDLITVRRYSNEDDPDRLRTLRGDDLLAEPLEQFQFIAVTPPPVLLPLLDVSQTIKRHGVETIELAFGLLSRARAILTTLQPPPSFIGIPSLPWSGYHPGRFYLSDLCQGTPACLGDPGPEPISQWRSDRHATESRPHDWAWVQQITHDGQDGSEEFICIWNAEFTPFKSKQTKDLSCLLAVFARTESDGSWTQTWPAQPDQQDEAPAETAANAPQLAVPAVEALEADPPPDAPCKADGPLPEIRPSLITSFCTYGTTLKSAAPLRPFAAYDGRVAAELYMLMDPEVRRWIGKWNRATPLVSRRSWRWRLRPPRTATEFLATLRKDDIRDLAQFIFERFTRKKIDIIALASFIPEIVRPKNTPEGKRAISALVNLVKFAQALQRLSGDVPANARNPQVVELVAGSQIRGICRLPSTSRTDEKIFAQLLGAAVARRHLLENLTIALSRVDLSTWRVDLALELEPGPYFLLNSWQSITTLVKELTGHSDSQIKDLPSHDLLRRHVGLNLDIAHWRLIDRVSPQLVENNPNVVDRIVHAHVAGHHRCAHFGDIPLLDLNTESEIDPWLQLLKRIAARRRTMDLTDNPVFSECVSVELEAAKDSAQVSKAVDDLLSMPSIP